MQFIDSVVVGTAVASVSFSGIPTDGNTLILKMSMSTSSTAVAQEAALTGYSTFDGQSLTGQGTNEVAAAETTVNFAIARSANSTFSNGEAIWLDYAQDTSYLSLRSGVANATRQEITLCSGIWTQTGGVSSFTITPAAGNIEVGSAFYLYKLKHS